MYNFSVTYEIITPKSAEYGEAEDSGFYIDGGTLRECYEAVCYLGGSNEVVANEYPMRSPKWVTFYGVNNEYETGAVTNYSIHFPRSITPSSAMRIARLFGA